MLNHCPKYEKLNGPGWVLLLFSPYFMRFGKGIYQKINRKMTRSFFFLPWSLYVWGNVHVSEEKKGAVFPFFLLPSGPSNLEDKVI